MAVLTLRCRNCDEVYTYTTPYPTYVGRVGEVESSAAGGAPRPLHPSCPNCTSHACHIMSQEDE